MTSRKPPPPAPVSLAPDAPASRPARPPCLPGIGYACCQLPLGLPALPHRFANGVNISAAQPVGGQARKVAQEVELIGAALTLAVCSARIEFALLVLPCRKHDVPLQIPASGRGELQLLGHHLIAGPEADIPDAAEAAMY